MHISFDFFKLTLSGNKEAYSELYDVTIHEV
ncbi:sigma-70 family RNA polymerase sigma factor, partial [Bacillus sp. D-CC]